MKTTTIAAALIALTLGASGSAFAQHGGYGNDRNDHGDRNDRAEQRHDNDRRDNDRHDNERYDSDRHDGPRGHAYGHDRQDNVAQHYHRDDMRGGGPRHDLRRGQRLDREYRDSRYVVTDWRARRLSAPPRGHHWVRAGNDYVLAAIATGVIAQVLLSN